MRVGVSLLLFLFIVIKVFKAGNSANILAIFPYVTIAHNNYIMPYIKELSEHGHNVTVINGFENSQIIPNTRFITVEDLVFILDEFDDGDFELPFTEWARANLISQYFYKISHRVLSNTEVQKLLQLDETFDLVIVEATPFDALFGFAQHFQAPLIGISSYGSSWNIDYLVGNPAPSIYESMSSLHYAEPLDLIGRLQNWIQITEERLLEHLIYLPKQKEIYKRYFPNAVMPLEELRTNFSLIMLNQHFSLGRSRLNVPNLIEVGGMHIPKTISPLPKDLEEFMNGTSEGIIYFSMGHDIMIKHLPKGTLDVLLQTFRSLKQRVVWKFESDHLPNKSDNVFISKWFSQVDVLAHPNVKMFISHGGLLSIIESVYFSKPVLGLPVFYDQFKNINSMVQSGMGLKLDINELSVEDLTAAINLLINNTSYHRQANILSERFRDQPMSPLQTAIWWTEYVLRHKGAYHMRLNANNLSFMQYYSLDTTLLILGRVGLTALVIIVVSYKMFSLFQFIPVHIRLSMHTST